MNLEIVNNLNKNVDLDVIREKQILDKIVVNVIDKGTDYILKAMPIQENVKDILLDVKKSFKTKDFNKIVQTALTSSLREGLEVIGAPVSVVKDLNKIKDIALKGGLRQALVTGVDIISDKYISGNILGDTVTKFMKEVKDFINSKRFSMKIDEDILKAINKQEKYKVLCSKWYKAYDQMDLDSLNKIAKEISSKQKTNIINNELLKSSNVILNMTEFVNNKKDKLSVAQLDVCRSL